MNPTPQETPVSLKGMTAVVTGAAEGLGRQIALRLASEGAALVVADVNDATTTVESAREQGVPAEQVHCDVMSEISVQEGIAKARELLGGRVDILRNNAGINGHNFLVKHMPLDSWENTLRGNLTGTMLATRAVIPAMEDRGGRIVNVASNVAKRGLPYRADYVASKWAILGLTQTLALELVGNNIRVNAVCPGPIEGARIEKVMQGHAEAEGRTLADVRR